MTENWTDIVAEKRFRQQDSIPKEWIPSSLPNERTLNVMKSPDASGTLTPKEIEITRSGVERLLKCLAKGTWSASEVTTAFSKRAVVAHLLTNCLTEIFVKRALARAAELDEHLKRTGKIIGPLHGLPISLKDQINVKGIESTMGYVSWIGKYAERNAVLVDILESLGAILYVKTNVPQSLMWGETFNHVFGRTLNPHNRTLTSGGSSGGEGAVVALQGAPIGVGSDIGGSIRIPAAFCGTYGFRPSHGRVPYAGAVNSLEGQDSINSVLGPLSNSLFGIKIFMQAVMSKQAWLKDPLVVRKRWDEEEYDLVDHRRGRELCFAVLWNDGSVIPHPPIVKGLETVKAALLVDGHRVIDWNPRHHAEIHKLAFSIWMAGLVEDVQAATSPTGEPVIYSMDLDQERVAPLPELPSVSAYELWQLHKRKRELRQEYLDHWQATASLTGTGRPVDAIIAPVAPYAAPPHGNNHYFAYTVVWNVLDYPALVMPVSKVTQADVKKPPHEFLSDVDKAVYEAYDPETYKDAPVAVQIIGRTFEDEAVIAMSSIVEAAVNKAACKSRF